MAKAKINEMPHSLEAEQALLCCILLDPRVQVEISSFLKEEDFFAESHKHIFNAMSKIANENQPVDIVTLTDMLEKQGSLEQAGGINYIAQLTNAVPSSVNYQRYLDIVTRDSLLRKLIVGASEIIETSKTSTDKVSALSFAEKKVYDISTSADTSEVTEVSKVISDVIAGFESAGNDKSKRRGIPTKFRGVDALLHGMRKSNLVILAARPAVGKTSFAMNIVESIALQGYSCAVFSLEMSKEEIVQRLVCSCAGVNMGNVIKGDISKTEWLKIMKAREKLSATKIFIDDSAIVTPQQIMSKCRRIKSRSGLDFVMIDYIQLMSPDRARSSDSRQNEITEISRYLKILAKELDIPVLALSQLNRAVETRKGRPQLADLRESGAIEQDADIVMFIHRPDKNATEKEIAEGKVQKNVAEIIVEKNRSGSTGVVKLYFKGENTRFINFNEESGEIEDGDQPQTVSVKMADCEELPPRTEEQKEPTPISEVVKSVDDDIF